ncbi:hypothetical protein SEA_SEBASTISAURUS_50 [Streptomyces phage Sebastisaurus]|uniref:Uncharacterized protein n=1 Tax=Streptomyces phage Sebastisaurus TaxID=2510572 RepID=A0A411B3V8_9CAUD|nr:hypothetical protein SEA_SEBASTISAURUS_50 [Streptomyces phage Sebastisaurus]
MFDPRPVSPLLIGDVRAPCPGPVDPETCPMCAKLRDHLTAAITTRHGRQASHVVRVMYVHMRQGHAKDPRHKTPVH